MSQEMHNKQQELENAKSENYGLREDATALRTVGLNLRAALEEAEIEKEIIRREKEDAVYTYEELNKKTKALEEKLEELRGVNGALEDRSSNAMASRNEKQEALRKENQTSRETREEVVAEPDRVPKAVSLGKDTTELAMRNWGDDSPPLSPFTPPERTLETQIGHRTDDTLKPENEMWSSFSKIDNAKFERYLFGEDDMVNIGDLAKDVLGGPSKTEGQAEELLPDVPPTAPQIKETNKGSQSSQTRKNIAMRFASHRRMPTMAPYNTDDAVIGIEDFTDDDVTGVNISLSQNTRLEQANPMPLVPKTRFVEERESKNRKRASNFESTPTERYSFTPATSSNKPKTPQRNDDSRGGPIDDSRKIQHRPRKERGKKNKDDQEWVEEGGPPKNNRGKEESPNMKKSLRSYKERKRGGKRFV